MKHYIKSITWKFKDTTVEYPELKNKRIKVTEPANIVENFRFCLNRKLRNGS